LPLPLFLLAAASFLAFPILLAPSQAPATPAVSQEKKAEAEKPKEPSEPGFPVTSALVEEKCGACHLKDEKGNLSRISWERTTPEGWEQSIKRMVRLNGVELKPEEARAIVKYLSNQHGLAPEEARPVAYVAERRMQDETIPEDYVRDACVSCHILGRAASWRRSKEEWDLLVTMHEGYYPVTEYTAFRRPPPRPGSPPPAAGADMRHPVERAIEYIAKKYPLQTPEWSAWRAGMRTPKLAGRWLVSGTEPGRGRIFGEMTVERGAAEDEFTTKTKLFYARTGATVTRTGRSIVYTGYAWRGRSTTQDSGVAPELREVMMVARDQNQAQGRWFWGAYDEFGIDVTMRLAGNDPTVIGLDHSALRTGSTAERVVIFGDRLPADLAPGDIDFGAGVTVKRVVSKSADRATIELDVAKDAILGMRDVAVRRSVLPAAFGVYDHVDYLKVIPDAGMARIGGAGHPKELQQFEAIAYNRGPDNKERTADDINLGSVEVEWSVEEFYSTIGDDDKDFVGQLDAHGLFTPAMEGPNPKRKFSRNNYGDVWVVATYKGKDAAGADKGGKPLTAKGHLIVTVPLYIRWDQAEVAR
jgi:quinohemoprotein amine dehydrogenase